MNAATWRTLRIHLRRGAAPAAVLATALLAGLILYSEADRWAGQWMTMAATVRFATLVLAPVAVTLAAWQGGRDRRHRVDEQLAATARPRWHRLLVAWAAVTLGCWLALLVVVAAAAVLVAPVATYTGGGWWWLLAVTPVALAAMTALGLALGQVVRFWLVAPVALIALYAAQVSIHDRAGSQGGVEWLMPIVAVHDAVGQTLSTRVHLLQALWFTGLAATALVVVGARRRWWVIVPMVVAVAGAAPLLGQSDHPRWQQDRVANALVCTDDEPLVCLRRYEAFLLDEVTPVAREALARFEDVPGGPRRAVSGWTHSSAESFLVIDTSARTWTGTLTADADRSLVRWWPILPCHLPEGRTDYRWLAEVAGLWGGGNEPPSWAGPQVIDGYAALLRLDQTDQQRWIGRFIVAARTCDQAALDELAGQLR